AERRLGVLGDDLVVLLQLAGAGLALALAELAGRLPAEGAGVGQEDEAEAEQREQHRPRTQEQTWHDEHLDDGSYPRPAIARGWACSGRRALVWCKIGKRPRRTRAGPALGVTAEPAGLIALLATCQPGWRVRRRDDQR